MSHQSCHDWSTSLEVPKEPIKIRETILLSKRYNFIAHFILELCVPFYIPFSGKTTSAFLFGNFTLMIYEAIISYHFKIFFISVSLIWTNVFQFLYFIVSSLNSHSCWGILWSLNWPRLWLLNITDVVYKLLETIKSSPNRIMLIDDYKFYLY